MMAGFGLSHSLQGKMHYKPNILSSTERHTALQYELNVYKIDIYIAPFTDHFYAYCGLVMVYQTMRTTGKVPKHFNNV